MITPEKFYDGTIGRAYDLDGVPVRDPYQCADYFKEACRQVLGQHWATGGDGYVDNWWYNRNQQHPESFTFITDWRQLQPGDFVIWAHSSRQPSSPFPSSHIGMYWEKNGKKYMVGQNQPFKYVSEKIVTDSVWSQMLGALRFKAWDITRITLECGKTTGSYNGISWTAVRAAKSRGYDLHVISAPGAYAVQDIDAFDSEKLQIAAGVNCNYFELNTGRHLGNEGDGYLRGYQQIVPLQSGWLAFFQRHGVTACWDTTAYYYDQKEVDFVCTPYAVRLFHGSIVFKRSTNCGDKDDVKNTQTAALRFSNGDWCLAIFSECCPRDVCNWALQYDGVEDLILMDSGGSTQMFECTSGERKIVRKTGRKVANALVLGRKITPGVTPESTPENPSQPTETPEDTPTETPETPSETPEEAPTEMTPEELRERVKELETALEEIKGIIEGVTDHE
ncbi:MAG: hypothetical protein IKF39_04225 [Oscillospiraceae bacterium]|nr:hypothetical protein [Oscillospiraceae bacterium]